MSKNFTIKTLRKMLSEIEPTSWDKFIDNPKNNWLRWTIYNLPDVPRDFYRKIKRGIQRGYRGWADEDIWDFDVYLATLIKQGLLKLQKDEQYLDSDEPEILERKQYLQTIINSFHTAELIQQGKYWYIPSEEWTLAKYNQVKEVTDFRKNRDIIVMTLDDVKRYEKGFEYFRRYFFNLWD